MHRHRLHDALPESRWTADLSETERECYRAVAGEFAAVGAPQHPEQITPFVMALGLLADARLNSREKDIAAYTEMIRRWSAEVNLSEAALRRLLRRNVN